MHLIPHPLLLEGVGQAAGIHLRADSVTPLSGGDISAAFCCSDSSGRRWFLKLNHANFSDAFAAEQAGLQELAKSTVRVAAAVATGIVDDSAWLLLEWLDLRPGGSAAASELGTRLAAMHGDLWAGN